MKTTLKLVGLLILVLLLVAFGRALFLPSRQVARVSYTPDSMDTQQASRNLAGAIAFPTI